MLLYLAPSLVLAVIFRALARAHPLFFGLYLAGTTLHELAHLLIGFITNARPIHFTVFPRRGGRSQWILGSVSFANVRWYNAAFVGLAPLLVLLMPLIVATVRVQHGLAYGWTDAAIALLIAPAFLSFLPSTIDLLMALRSWPYVLLSGAWLWWRWH
jgi:hypothetical protein